MRDRGRLAGYTRRMPAAGEEGEGKVVAALAHRQAGASSRGGAEGPFFESGVLATDYPQAKTAWVLFVHERKISANAHRSDN